LGGEQKVYAPKAVIPDGALVERGDPGPSLTDPDAHSAGDVRRRFV
jgi:hypothetical protein